MTLKLNFFDPLTPRQDFCEYFNDFIGYTAGDWTITVTQAGSGSAAEAVQNAAGGILLITNDNADDDRVFYQWPYEAFKYVAGKKFYFGARFKVSDATQSDIIMGLQITDTTPLAVSDGLWFQKDDGDAFLDFHAAKGSTQTDVTAIATLADDTYVTVEWYYDGANKIELFVNGATVGGCALTNMPTTEELCVSFGIQNGEAVIKTMSVDWIRVLLER